MIEEINRFKEITEQYLGDDWKVIEQARGFDFKLKISLLTDFEIDMAEVSKPGFDIYQYLIPKLRDKLKKTRVLDHHIKNLEAKVEELEAKVAELKDYETHYKLEQGLRS